MNKKYAFLFLLLTSCGYRWEGSISPYKTSIYVPFAVNDLQGDLTARVIEELSATGKFVPSGKAAAYTLNLEVEGVYYENIGFRYYRKKWGNLSDSVIPCETRVKKIVLITLKDNRTCQPLFLPAQIEGSVDFDHTFYSARDEVNIFSLGQLIDIDAAKDEVESPLNRVVAKKIAEYLTENFDFLRAPERRKESLKHED